MYEADMNERIINEPGMNGTDTNGPGINGTDTYVPEQAGEKENENVIECDSLVKLYKTDAVEVLALQGLDLTVKKGELMAIIGKSGSGKSTLLNIIGGLEKPSAGKIKVCGKDIGLMNEKELTVLRKKTIGFIWQKASTNLFPYMTALENIEAQLYFDRVPAAERRRKAMELLEEVELSDKASSYPTELSGGQQQRIAIAMSLVRDPEIILADEPTGAVDTKTSDMIQNLFRRINKERGVTIIIVTHDISLANKVNRVVMISDGKVSTEKIIKEQYRKQIDEIGEEGGFADDTHEEFTVLDKAGRLKLTDEIRQEAGIDGNRVKIVVEDGKIVITKTD